MKVLKKLKEKIEARRAKRRPWAGALKAKRDDVRKARAVVKEISKRASAVFRLSNAIETAGLDVMARYSGSPSIRVALKGSHWARTLDDVRELRGALRKAIGSWGDSVSGTMIFSDGDVEFTYSGMVDGIEVCFDLILPLEEGREHLEKVSPGCEIKETPHSYVSHSIVCGRS